MRAHPIPHPPVDVDLACGQVHERLDVELVAGKDQKRDEAVVLPRLGRGEGYTREKVSGVHVMRAG